MKVQSAGRPTDGEGASDFEKDIDFVVTLGARKMTLRSASREEKTAWTKALETASVVRSYSSKNLDDGSEAEINAGSEMKTLVLADLDIGEIIGSGSAGTVKLAVHISTGMRVAVKVIPKRKFFMNKKLEETTNRELAMLDRIATFDHPHIVRTFGYINDPDNVYIALELCEGGELLEELEHIGNYTEHDAATIMMNCVDTLGYLHARGIVHRDIKPENLLLKVKGSPDSVKLADFGLANIMEGKDSLQTVCGSPAYMAPEVHKMKDYDEKCDLWSMGVMLFLLLSGRLPFLPPRLVEKAELQSYDFEGQLWDCVSDAAKDLVVHLLVADPKLRYGVADVQSHPWITGEDRQDIDLAATQKAIALFSAKRKFKGMAHAVIASGRMKKALASFAMVAAENAAAVAMMVADTATDAAYTAMDAGDKAANTADAKTAISAARTAAELEGVKQARAVAEAGVDQTAKVAQNGKKKAKKGKARAEDSMVAHVLHVVDDKVHHALDNVTHLALSPHADEARKEKMRHVVIWLDRGRLGLYAEKFEEEGYDDLQALRELEDDEVEELIEEVGMKKGHARGLWKRVHELRDAIDIDQYGNPLRDEKDDPADFKTLFIPYDRLPMPLGRDSDLNFQLGVGIGRVKKQLSEDEKNGEMASIDEVHDWGTGKSKPKSSMRKRLKSPPKERPTTPTASPGTTPKVTEVTNPLASADAAAADDVLVFQRRMAATLTI